MYIFIYTYFIILIDDKNCRKNFKRYIVLFITNVKYFENWKAEKGTFGKIEFL